MDTNQRRHVRIRTDRRIEVRRIDRVDGSVVDESVSARVVNVSAGGALLIMDRPIWRTARIEMRVEWRDPDLAALLRGQVLRVVARDDRFEASVRFDHPERTAPLDLIRWVLHEAQRTNQLADRVAA